MSFCAFQDFLFAPPPPNFQKNDVTCLIHVYRMIAYLIYYLCQNFIKALLPIRKSISHRENANYNVLNI